MTTDVRAQAAPAPTPTPFLPSVQYSVDSKTGQVSKKTQKNVFVMAINGDAPTRAKFIGVLTKSLQHYYDLGAAHLQPQPDWDIPRFIDACQNHPEYTQGALIVVLGDISNYSRTVVIVRTTYSALQAQLLYATCGDPVLTAQPSLPAITNTPTPEAVTDTGGSRTITRERATTQASTNTTEKHSEATTVAFTVAATPKPVRYAVAWGSAVVGSRGSSVFVNALEGVSLILAGVAVWAAVTPSRTTGATITTNYPTPAPGSIVPPSGSLATVVNTDQKVSNPNQLGSVSNAFLGSALTSTSNLQQGTTNDKQILDAVKNIVEEFARQLRCPARPTAPPSPATQKPSPPNGTDCLLYYTTN
jgi:hypothetical protein